MTKSIDNWRDVSRAFIQRIQRLKCGQVGGKSPTGRTHAPGLP